MKKPALSLLLGITFAFAAFTFGFFLGRNEQLAPISVQLSPDLQARPAETTPTLPAPTQTEAVILFPIDINSAGKEEFMALPGIGEVLAQRILSYREEHGGFTVVEELMMVEGIGAKRIEAILDLITIGGAQ